MSMDSLKRVCLGTYLTVLAVVIVLALLILWPVENKDGTWEQMLRLPWSIQNLIDPADPAASEASRGVMKIMISDNGRLLLLIACLGALGSFVHAATSFASYTGNETLRFSWLWWYFLRPWIGMALALIVYFVIRGGLLSAATDGKQISLYGVTAVAGLVGMFSKQATDKLDEVFKTLFRTSRGEGDDARKHKLDQMVPVEQAMIPLDRIEKLSLDAQQTEANTSIRRLLDMLGPTVTRIPVFEENTLVKYVIHESQIYKFVAHKLRENSGFDINQTYLVALLNWGKVGEMVRALAFVRLNATIGDAKSAMTALENCRDVFVTQNGTENEPVLGWLTNIEIGKRIGT